MKIIAIDKTIANKRFFCSPIFFILVDFFEKEKEPHGNLANGAIYILSEEFLKILNKNFKNSKNFTKDIVVNFKNKIFCYKTKDTFIDIGNINSLNQANFLFLKKVNF